MYHAEPSEYAALTAGCGLVEPAEDGKLAIVGPQAASFLTGQVTNDIEGLATGTGCYAALLTNKGKMLADLRVLRVSDEELLLLTERMTLQPLFDQVRRGLIGWDAELHKRTLEQTRLVLVGPRARQVAGAGALAHTEHASVHAQIAQHDVLLVATDTGLEVICAAPDADAVRIALLDAGAVAVAEPAAEVVRVEHGRPRYGPDLDETVIPQEASLNERAVSFTKGCYVGQETVARMFYRGKPNRRLVGLRLDAPADPDDVLTLGDREVGHVGSVARSPRLGLIALALVRREAEIGAVLDLGDSPHAATVVELPFPPPPIVA